MANDSQKSNDNTTEEEDEEEEEDIELEQAFDPNKTYKSTTRDRWSRQQGAVSQKASQAAIVQVKMALVQELAWFDQENKRLKKDMVS